MNKNLLRSAGLVAVMGSAAFAQTHVTSNITANTTWTTAGSPYVLEGVIYVENGATLDIAPGVIVRGQPVTTATSNDPGTLIVTRTGKIQIRGSSASPVIFTTAALDAGLMAGGARNGLRYDNDLNGVPDRWTAAAGNTKWLDLTPATAPLPLVNSAGVRNSSLWGGLVVLGNASINAAYDTDLPADGIKNNGSAFMEGLNTTTRHVYGGSDDFDNSGIIRYVSLRHGGYTIAENKELNGLTLCGVGAGTSVDHVDIYNTSDDGVEIFGGTVNVSYLNITAAEDDGLDTDQGYRGTTQFVYVAHGLSVDHDNDSGTAAISMVSSSDPRGMELDGDDANESGTPITPGGLPLQDHRIYNATVQTNGQIGAVLRRAWGGVIANSVFHTSAAQATAIDFNTSVGTGSIAVRTRFADQEIQIRNTSFNGFSAVPADFTATPTGSSTAVTYNWFNALGHSTGVIYPVTNNRWDVAGTIGGAAVTAQGADLQSITATAGGLNPRLGAGPATPAAAATGATQASSYVLSPAVSTSYKGAFALTGTLWTTGWTAANRANVNGVKLLVD